MGIKAEKPFIFFIKNFIKTIDKYKDICYSIFVIRKQEFFKEAKTMMKERLTLKENPNKWNVLEVETVYNLGGMNYFTGRTEARGYYLHVHPAEIHGNCIRVTGFSGIKYCLKEVKRKSAKAEAEADRIAENVKQQYINYVLQKHGLKLE